MPISTNTIDQALATAVEGGTLAGVAAAAWSRGGLRYAAAFGEHAEGKAMRPDTIVWIASMTKAVTGASVMQLVERGVIGLDQPAGDLVPYLRTVQVLDGFDDDGRPRLRDPKTPLTVRQLLTHTSGFAYDFTDDRIASYVSAVAPAAPGSTASYEHPLVFDPGEGWAYGIGIDWAGQVVEAATGQRLDAYFDAHLFEPLGMVDTSFARSPEQLDRAAAVHLRTPDGLLPIPFELPPDPEMLMAGGGLYSTVVDYLRFARMILDEGTLDGVRVLAPETVATMRADHLDELNAGGWTSCNATMSNDVALFPGERAGWGLTFLVNDHRTSEGRSPGSLAWAGLANTYYWIDPAAGVTGVFVTQVLPFFDEAALSAFAAFERAVYDAIA